MRLSEQDLFVSRLLLDKLEIELTKPEVEKFTYEQLGSILDYMESIKRKMQLHWLKYKQIEVVEQMIGFDVLINLVRKLQNKNDVASM